MPTSGTVPFLPRLHRPRVEIYLANESPGCVSTYTTSDLVQGAVTITADHDIPFEDISITLNGSASTAMERVSAMRGGKRSHHNFLQLHHHIDTADFPSPRIFQAGHSYLFPFTFSVPKSLVPQACTHPSASPLVSRSHLLLPPTMGDPMITNEGRSLLDDMCPDACNISYRIRVAVTRQTSVPTDPPKTLAHVGKKLRILPTFDEQPPLNITKDDDYYRLCKEVDVKRGLLREKVGRLEVIASQPNALRLPRPGSSADAEPSTMTTVTLRFTPDGDEKPPQLEDLSIKLKSTTFFAADYWPNTPTNPYGLVFPPRNEFVYTKAVPILSSSFGSMEWTPVPCGKSLCRDSRTSNSSTESVAATNTYYTASITAPIVLPRHKTCTPTFHCCLISRVYSLDLKVSYHAPNAHLFRASTSSTSLRLPLQICSPHSATENKSDTDTPSILSEIRTDEQTLGYLNISPQHVRYFEPVIVSLATPESPQDSAAENN